MFKGILLGVGGSFVSIILYVVWLRSKFPGPQVVGIDARWPALFAYGVAIGISLVSTTVLLVLRALQIYAEHVARINRQ